MVIETYYNAIRTIIMLNGQSKVLRLISVYFVLMALPLGQTLYTLFCLSVTCFNGGEYEGYKKDMGSSKPFNFEDDERSGVRRRLISQT